MREIVRATAWGGFRETVAELGGDADEILAAAHVDVMALKDPERYMPLRALIDCMEIGAERLGRRDFGLLLGARQNSSMLGAIAIAIHNSATAREGIEVGARYLHVHNPALTMTLAPVVRTTRDFLDFHLDIRRPIKREQNTERMLTSIHMTLQLLVGNTYKPFAVWFPHAQISPMSAYLKAFGIAPVFNRPRLGISIERAILDNWRPGASSQLRQIAETYLRQISPPRDNTLSLRVAHVARNLLRGGDSTPEQTATALGMHPRTLQRRLRAEGTSFEKIKDDVRRGLAESMLSQANVPLSQIASLLDYADSSAFSRSCRRWYGEAPSAVRKRLLAGKAPPPPPAPRGSRVKEFETKILRSKRA